jgi:hypothetical protein
MSEKSFHYIIKYINIFSIYRNMIKKEVKENTPKIDFYFTIYEYVKNNKKLPTLKISKQLRQYYLKRLIIYGAVYKKGYGVYENNPKKWAEFRSKIKDLRGGRLLPQEMGTKDKFKIRGHNYQFKICIPEIQNWRNLGKYLTSRQLPYTKKGTGRGFISINMGEDIVWFCKDSIIIYFNKNKSYIGQSAQDCQTHAIDHAKTILISIENILGISLKKNKSYDLRITRQHHAQIKNELAQEVNRTDQKLQIKGEDQKTWLLVDNSFKLDELEAVHSERSQPDMDQVITPFFNLLRQNPHILEEMLLIEKNNVMITQENTKHISQILQIISLDR